MMITGSNLKSTLNYLRVKVLFLLKTFSLLMLRDIIGKKQGDKENV